MRNLFFMVMTLLLLAVSAPITNLSAQEDIGRLDGTRFTVIVGTFAAGGIGQYQGQVGVQGSTGYDVDDVQVGDILFDDRNNYRVDAISIDVAGSIATLDVTFLVGVDTQTIPPQNGTGQITGSTDNMGLLLVTEPGSNGISNEQLAKLLTSNFLKIDQLFDSEDNQLANADQLLDGDRLINGQGFSLTTTAVENYGVNANAAATIVGQAEVTISTTSAGKVKIGTPAVAGATAGNGEVLALVDNTTGEVEYVDVNTLVTTGDLTIGMDSGSSIVYDPTTDVTYSITGGALLSTSNVSDNVQIDIDVTGATNGQVLSYDGSTVVWGDAQSPVTTENGITKTGDVITLGGSLNANTTIDGGDAFSILIDNADFGVDDNFAITGDDVSIDVASGLFGLNTAAAAAGDVTGGLLQSKDANGDEVEYTTYSFPSTDGTDGDLLTVNASGDIAYSTVADVTDLLTIDGDNGDTYSYDPASGNSLSLNGNNLIETNIINANQEIFIQLNTTGAADGDAIIYDGTDPQWTKVDHVLSVAADSGNDFNYNPTSAGLNNSNKLGFVGVDGLSTSLVYSLGTGQNDVRIGFDFTGVTNGQVLSYDGTSTSWVDGQSPLVFGSGLTETAGTVDLGGALSSYAVISSDGTYGVVYDNIAELATSVNGGAGVFNINNTGAIVMNGNSTYSSVIGGTSTITAASFTTTASAGDMQFYASGNDIGMYPQNFNVYTEAAGGVLLDVSGAGSTFTVNTVSSAANDVTGRALISQDAAGVLEYAPYAFPTSVGTDGQIMTVNSSGDVEFTTNTPFSLTVDTDVAPPFSVDGSETLQITGDGNVIQTTSPSPDNNTVRILFDGSGGTAGQFLVTDGTNVSWTDSEAPLTFANGLTRTGDNVQLGGLMTASTIIDGVSTHSLEFEKLDIFGVESLNNASIQAGGRLDIEGTGSVRIRNDQVMAATATVGEVLVLDNVDGTISYEDVSSLIPNTTMTILDDSGASFTIDLTTDSLTTDGYNLIEVVSDVVNNQIDVGINTTGADAGDVITFDGGKPQWGDPNNLITTGALTLTADAGTNVDYDPTAAKSVAVNGGTLVSTSADGTDLTVEIDVTGATTGQAITYDGTNPVWADVEGPLTFDNGLTRVGTNTQLGGALTQNTTITGGGSNSFALTGVTSVNIVGSANMTYATTSGDVALGTQSGNLSLFATGLNTGSVLQNTNGTTGVAEYTPYALPTAAGTLDQVLVVDASGDLVYGDANALVTTGDLTISGDSGTDFVYDPTADTTVDFLGVDLLEVVGVSNNRFDIGFNTTGATSGQAPLYNGTSMAWTDVENPLSFASGLTRTGDDVTLGGTLTADTDIDADGTYDFVVSDAVDFSADAQTLTISATTEMRIVTPAVGATTATVGQALVLQDAATGEVEFENIYSASRYDAGSAIWVLASGPGVTATKAAGSITITVPAGIQLTSFKYAGTSSDLNSGEVTVHVDYPSGGAFNTSDANSWWPSITVQQRNVLAGQPYQQRPDDNGDSINIYNERFATSGRVSTKVTGLTGDWGLTGQM